MRYERVVRVQRVQVDEVEMQPLAERVELFRLQRFNSKNRVAFISDGVVDAHGVEHLSNFFASFLRGHVDDVRLNDVVAQERFVLHLEPTEAEVGRDEEGEERRNRVATFAQEHVDGVEGRFGERKTRVRILDGDWAANEFVGVRERAVNKVEQV